MPDNLKIAYYLQRFPTITETFILREMIFLRKMGLDIQVFSVLPPFSTSTMHDQVQEMMPYVHYSPYLFSIRLILAQLYFLSHSPLKYFKALQRALWQTLPEPKTLGKMLILFPKSVYFAKQLRELKVNHIHAHFVALSGLAAQIASDLTGISYSLHAHAYDIFMRDQESVRRQMELATGIITVSEYHRAYIAELCPRWNPENIHVVHYGLDMSEFTPKQVPAVDKAFRIISVGSLVEKKGHEYLIDACKILTAKGYKIYCSIIGGGPLQQSLQRRINDQGLQEVVSLLGTRNQTQIQDLYHHSDLFVLACVIALSGDRDGMPNVLLEAMAMGLPVITTPVTGNPELIKQGENGLLVPERNAHALAQEIERLIKDPSLGQRLGQQGHQTVIAEYDIHHSAAQMADIFQEYAGIGKDRDENG